MKKQIQVPGRVTKLRSRFFVALLRFNDDFYKDILNVAVSEFNSLENHGGNVVFSLRLRGLSDKPFFDCLRKRRLPRWQWFPEIAREFLSLIFLNDYLEADEHWPGQYPTMRGYIEKLMGEYTAVDSIPDNFECSGWNPEVQSETEFRRFVQRELDLYTDRIGKAAPKPASHGRHGLTDDQRLEILARRFFGEELSEIRKTVAPLLKNPIGRTIASMCSRLQIEEPPPPRRGRPGSISR